MSADWNLQVDEAAVRLGLSRCPSVEELKAMGWQPEQPSFSLEGCALFDLPGEIRDQLLLWAFAFFLVGCFCGAACWAWLDYRAVQRRRRQATRYKLPCHVWLAVAPWVLVQPPWLVFLALVAVGGLLILWMAVATMSATQDRAAEEEYQSRNGKAESGNGPRTETAARWGRRALPEQPFTGVDPL